MDEAAMDVVAGAASAKKRGRPLKGVVVPGETVAERRLRMMRERNAYTRDRVSVGMYNIYDAGYGPAFAHVRGWVSYSLMLAIEAPTSYQRGAWLYNVREKLRFGAQLLKWVLRGARQLMRPPAMTPLDHVCNARPPLSVGKRLLPECAAALYAALSEVQDYVETLSSRRQARMDLVIRQCEHWLVEAASRYKSWVTTAGTPEPGWVTDMDFRRVAWVAKGDVAKIETALAAAPPRGDVRPYVRRTLGKPTKLKLPKRPR